MTARGGNYVASVFHVYLAAPGRRVALIDHDTIPYEWVAMLAINGCVGASRGWWVSG